MTDVVNKETRSRMMSGIRSKDTKPELIIRKGLFAKGLRYRLHDKHLPGKSDLVLKQYCTVIFIHGCFWHGHGCHLFRWPSTRPDFWEAKIARNREKDVENDKKLRHEGWRIITVWECAIKGKTRLPHERIIQHIINALQGGLSITIKGRSI